MIHMRNTFTMETDCPMYTVILLHIALYVIYNKF